MNGSRRVTTQKEFGNHGTDDLVQGHQCQRCSWNAVLDTQPSLGRGIVRVGQLFCRDRLATTSADERTADGQRDL